MVDRAGDWPWSSYQATVGAVPVPGYLETDWLLSQFGRERGKALTAYVKFVDEEMSDSPWKSLNGPDILGDDDFRGQLQGNAGKASIGIPKRKQLLRHLPLSDIARSDRERSDWMREAYRDHGYTMQEIANFSCLHHSTVSRLIKTEDENARNES